jgi:putative ATP-binding cassette transporter
MPRKLVNPVNDDALDPLLSEGSNELDISADIADGELGFTETKDFNELWQAEVSNELVHFGINAKFFRRLCMLIHIGWDGCCGRTVLCLWGNLFSLFTTSFILVFLVLPLLGPFLEGMYERDVAKVFHLSTAVLIYICILSVSISFQSYFGSLLALRWRLNITKRLTAMLMQRKMLYQLLALDRRLDNMDQRITDGAKDFTDQFTTLVFGSLTSPFGLIFQLVSALMSLFSLFQSNNWITPALVAGTFLFFALLQILPISQVSKLTFVQDQFEGDFRFTHELLRMNTEVVAFYQGESRERQSAANSFHDL